MEGTFSEVIGSSWKWTRTILFRPFQVKKWIFLCLIALLSAEFSGCQMNLNLPFKNGQKKPAMEAGAAMAEHKNVFNPHSLERAKNKLRTLALPIIAGVIVFGILIFLFLMWLCARFNFVFINSIVNNDASIKKPFFEYWLEGNSYFKWGLGFLFITFVAFIVLVVILAWGIIYFKKISAIAVIIFAAFWGLLFLGTLFAAIITAIVVRDLVLPVMYKQKTTLMDAWYELSPVISEERVNVFKYLLIKLGLIIIASIIGGIITFFVFFALLIPAGVTGGLLYALSLALPAALKIGYYILMALLGISCLFVFIFFINTVLLPISVFFRTLSLKFLSRLGAQYDVFRID